jgi:hypothetical protein
MYLGAEKGLFNPPAAPGDRPPGPPPRPIDQLRWRPLLPRYRLAAGWAEICHDWSVADLHQAHLVCDEIDEASAEQ